jgi:predicted transcriptional regulator
MLGRLLEEGLISETDSGKYKITSKGMDIAADVDSVHSIMQKQLDVVMRVGNVGKFVAMDMIDRLSAIGLTLSSNLDKMTEQEREKYKQFLVSELKKLQEQESKKDELRIDSD